MKIFVVAFALLSLSGFLSSASLAQSTVEIKVNNKTAPASGWAVISLQQGTEPRPVGGGQGGLTFDDMAGAAAVPLFISAPLIWVENSRGDLSFRVDQYGPEGIFFSFESSIADIGLESEKPFAYIAWRVNPEAEPGRQALIHIDPQSTVLYDETGERYSVMARDGLFTVGGLSISCIDPVTGPVQAGQEVTIYGVGFRTDLQTDVAFDGRTARRASVVDENTIVAVAPQNFQADSVAVRVRTRLPGPRGERLEDIFVSYRFGCFGN